MHSEDGVESEHTLEMDGVPVDAAWDPTTTREATESPAGNGHWTIKAKGKNHQNGCKGEDDGVPGTGVDDLSFRIKIEPVG